jgi:UDP-3-O-[3-hydroxymyristoyl] glucosamine N-acyltransferase
MAVSLERIAELTGGRLLGDGSFQVDSIAPLGDAGPGQISFAVSRKFEKAALASRAGALILPEDWPEEALRALNRPVVLVKNPYLAYAKVASLFFREEFRPTGIHERAVVGRGCSISEDVSIGANVVIGDGVRIASGVTIHPGSVIGDGVSIGADTTIFPNVTIYKGCRIGRGVRIHAGSVIGADGFGFATDEEGRHHKIPQVGIVVIEDGVEIGANTTIDRAAFGETRIGAGSMIDNLVMIAHNVQIGAGSIIVAQAGIAGSTKVGRGVVIAAQAGIVGHIEIGDRAIVTAKSGVPHSVEASEAVSGIPAMPHRQFLRVAAAYKRLPEMAAELRELKRQVKRLSEDRDDGDRQDS